MVRGLLVSLCVAWSGALLGAGCGGETCTSLASLECLQGATYWFDSCGKQERKQADCPCGCNQERDACLDSCCVPDCQGRTCGLDPICGTLDCGTCTAAESPCNDAGQCAAGCTSCTGAHLWSHGLGGPSWDEGLSLAFSPVGDVLVTGSFTQTASFGGDALTSAGDRDIFLALFDPDGGHVWSKRFGSLGFDEGTSVAVGAGGQILVTGDFEGTLNLGESDLDSAGAQDAFVARFSLDGQLVWGKRLGGAGADHGLAVSVDPQGNVLVAGTFEGSVNLGGQELISTGQSDVFLLKLDADGNHVWSQRFGGTGDDQGRAVVTAPEGDVLVTGSFSGSMDAGGGSLTSAGNTDIFVVKFDAAGGHRWSKRFGSSGFDRGTSIAAYPGGKVWVTGVFYADVDFGNGALTSAGEEDGFVVKLDADGNPGPSMRFGGPGTDHGASIAVDRSGNALLTGAFQDSMGFEGELLTSAGGRDSFAVKLDSFGQVIWIKRFGGPGDDRGTAVATDPDEDVALLGSFLGTVDFGGGAQTSAGEDDLFVVKLAR